MSWTKRHLPGLSAKKGALERRLIKVPTRWRSAGRLNLIGSLSRFGPTEQLEVRSVWRKLKGFLMPRRCYNTLDELKAALNLGLKVLNVTYI